MAPGDVFRFAHYTLDVAERTLANGDDPIQLAPKTCELLVALLREAGHVVTKQQLLARVWPGAFVEEGILTVHIAALRKALGDVAKPFAYIQTLPRAGYRFIVPVTRP